MDPQLRTVCSLNNTQKLNHPLMFYSLTVVFSSGNFILFVGMETGQSRKLDVSVSD